MCERRWALYLDDSVQNHPRDGILSPAAGENWFSAPVWQAQPNVKTISWAP